jgi:hypothetical protein
MGMRMKPACTLPSAALTLGIQKRPSCRPYSTVMAEMVARIGLIIPFTHAGGASSSASRRAFCRPATVVSFAIASSSSRRVSSSATLQMSMGTDMRYAARTSWPLSVSNQNEPTNSFQSGRRALMRSSRSPIVRPVGSRMLTESPVA